MLLSYKDLSSCICVYVIDLATIWNRICFACHSLSVSSMQFDCVFHLIKTIFCFLVSIKGISTYSFPIDGRTLSRWLEHQVSPPRRLTAFTIIFQMKCGFFPPNPYQIACYGDQGVPCRLSVVIHKNLTLETTIASTR